jgi:hypothetical protein
MSGLRDRPSALEHAWDGLQFVPRNELILQLSPVDYQTSVNSILARGLMSKGQKEASYMEQVVQFVQLQH